MSGQWVDLENELRHAKREAHSHGHDWDVADAVEAVASWLGIPPPRQSTENQ